MSFNYLLQELRKLCCTVRKQFPTVERVILWHRIGEVAVGEASVIVAAASPHRFVVFCQIIDFLVRINLYQSIVENVV